MAFDASTRATHGTRERARHRVGRPGIGSDSDPIRGKGIGQPMILCDPPAYLTTAQRKLWRYYGPQLASEGRLPLKSRDTLGKYVITLNIVITYAITYWAPRLKHIVDIVFRDKQISAWIKP